jgi:hypothetical protein
MLKQRLGGRALSLSELRSVVSHAFDAKETVQGARPRLLSNFMRELRDKYQVCLSDRVSFLLEKTVSEAEEGAQQGFLELMHNDDWADGEHLLCRDGNTVHTVTATSCSCGYTTCYGLPCTHLVFVHSQLGDEFPVYCISPRWLIGEAEGVPVGPQIRIESMRDWIMTISSGDSDDPDFVHEASEDDDGSALMVDIELVRQRLERAGRKIVAPSDVSEPDSNPSDDEILPSEDSDGDDSEAVPLPADSDDQEIVLNATEMYQRLHYLGKEIARTASIDNRLFDLAVSGLEGLLHEIAERTPLRESVDQPRANKRGRPAKAGHGRAEIPKRGRRGGRRGGK